MKLKNICFGIVCTVALVGCTDKMDYHEYTNYGKEYVFSDFGRTAAFVNNIYSYLDYDLLGTTSLASACDEAEMALNYSNVLDYTNGNWTALNPKSQWNYYTPIRAANYFLENGLNLEFSDLILNQDYEAQMKRYGRYQYEVRLLRAYYYFLLVRAYGDVPFTTKVLTEAEANSLERTPASQVFDFIISECDAVAPQLPVDYSKLDNDAAGGTNPEAGRVTRGAALALKARASLYCASKLFNDSENRDLYKRAATASLDVINYCGENNITLGKYTDLWGADNWKASEMIFVRRVGDTDDPERTNFPIGMENAKSGNCPTQTLVDAYEMKNGGEPNQKDPYTGRDPRFAMTIAVNGDKWPNTNPNPLEIYTGGRDAAPVPYATPTGYYVKKYVDGATDISASTSSGGKRHSWITFRLGEFLLNYAEAMNEWKGPDETAEGCPLTARQVLNMVRDCADMKHIDANGEEFTAKVRYERRIELAFEGHRFYDIRRWKIAGLDEVRNLYGVKITKNGTSLSYQKVLLQKMYWDDKMYLFPYPQNEIYMNPDLGQNPGWNNGN